MLTLISRKCGGYGRLRAGGCDDAAVTAVGVIIGHLGCKDSTFRFACIRISYADPHPELFFPVKGKTSRKRPLTGTFGIVFLQRNP